MRIALLIATTLAAASCAEDSGCPPPPDDEEFTLAVEIDESTVAEMLENFAVSEPAQLLCDDVCTFLQEGDSYEWRVTGISSCTLELDAMLTGDPAAIVGSVDCAGYHTDYICTGGRRPLGHVKRVLSDGGLPAFLAHCARLEAASVVAFVQLAGRLSLWGAPAELVARCRAAAREEATHARLLGDLARAAGAEVEPATQRPVPVDLACAALDNAIEGCVHEAWSALACAATAERGAPALRGVYAEIAADEAGHAQLAWDLHTWFMGQVSPDERAGILAAQRAALAGLPGLARAQARLTPAALALPDAATAERFAAGLALAA